MSETKYQTTNKSDRDLNLEFEEQRVKTNFLENILQNLKTSQDMNHYDEILHNKLPHEKPVQDIIINIREMFYKTLELLVDKKNPIPYIISTPDRYFSFAVFLLVIGSLLLLFSNLMISSENK